MSCKNANNFACIICNDVFDLALLAAHYPLPAEHSEEYVLVACFGLPGELDDAYECRVTGNCQVSAHGQIRCTGISFGRFCNDKCSTRQPWSALQLEGARVIWDWSEGRCRVRSSGFYTRTQPRNVKNRESASAYGAAQAGIESPHCSPTCSSAIIELTNSPRRPHAPSSL